jgi:hypothetical protein
MKEIKENGLGQLDPRIIEALPIIKELAYKEIQERLQKAEVQANSFGSLLKDLDYLQFDMQTSLPNLAISRICEEFGILEGEIDFKADLATSDQFSPLSVPETVEISKLNQQERQEVYKRRAINMIIQGGAHMFQLAFLLDKNEETAELMDTSRKFIAVTDRMIWNMPVDENQQTLGTPAGTSQVRIITEGDKQKICVEAKAIHFPVLVHELAKGVIEGLALHGLPQDKDLREKVLNCADRPIHEVADLKYGPELYRRILSAFPKDITAREKSMLLVALFKLQAEPFNHLVATLFKTEVENKALNIFFEEKLKNIRN